MLDHARDNEWTRDPFGWMLALSSHEVPPEMEEMAASYWEKGELDRAEKVFGLLVDAFPGYAEAAKSSKRARVTSPSRGVQIVNI